MHIQPARAALCARSHFSRVVSVLSLTLTSMRSLRSAAAQLISASAQLPRSVSHTRKQHPRPIEAVEPLHRDEQIDPATADRGKVYVRVHGAEERAAHMLKELVLADVEVIALTRVRSDLEDVYTSIGRDEVS